MFLTISSSVSSGHPVTEGASITTGDVTPTGHYLPGLGLGYANAAAHGAG